MKNIVIVRSGAFDSTRRMRDLAIASRWWSFTTTNAVALRQQLFGEPFPLLVFHNDELASYQYLTAVYHLDLMNTNSLSTLNFGHKRLISVNPWYSVIGEKVQLRGQIPDRLFDNLLVQVLN